MELLRKDKKITLDELQDFVNGCNRIFLYGAGKVAAKLGDMLNENNILYEAFVVSDGKKNAADLMGHPVLDVDKVEFTASDGLILAVGEQARTEIIKSLNEEGCPAQVYVQQIFGRIIKIPEDFLRGSNSQQGYFARFSELDKIGEKFDTDKSHKGHDYLRKYELFLQYFRDKEFTLLELGVFHGGSLSTWGGYKSEQGYFTKARIVGADINPDCRMYVDGQEVLIKDLGKWDQLEELCELHPSVIVDDASHFCSHQIMALLTLWKAIPDGGIYIMEDIDTSFPHIGYVGYDDATVTAYDVCQAIAEFVTSGGPLRSDFPLREDIERIASEIDMISFIHGSCIMIKK